MIATVVALVAVVAAVALAGYGVLLRIATSDTATSSLFLAGLVLVGLAPGHSGARAQVRSSVSSS